jgi:diguanylate cyclase (GGDEF)-like protein/PAS domain S-box-containing protein
MPPKRERPLSTDSALGKHATRFQSLLEAVPDALVGVDRAGVIRFVNRQTEVLFGYGRDDLLGLLIETLVPETVRTVHQAQREGYAAAPTPRPVDSALELSGLRRDGTVFPAEISLSPITTEDGLLVIAAIHDLTDRKRAEEGRRRSDRLAAIVEYSGDAIIGKTLDGTITSWNPAAEKLYGYGGAEMVGRSIFLLSPDKRTDDEMTAVLAAIGSGQPVECFETMRVRKSGSAFPASLTVSPIVDAGGVIVGASTISRDLTEARRAFAAARSMIESSLDSMVAISPEGKITDANEATVKVTGIPREELIGTAFSDCFTEPDNADRIYQLVFDQGMAVDYPLTMRHRDGTLTEVLYNASVHRDTCGTVLGVFAAARDVTALQQAAQNVRSLAAAEDMVRTLMASATIGIGLTDLDGAFRVVNRSLCDLLGYDEAWFLAHTLEDIVPSARSKDLSRGAHVLAGRVDQSVVTLRLIRADTATVWVRRVTVLILDGNGEPRMLMVQVEDITAEHDAQEALSYQAFHDPLTGLHNRAWILDVLAVDLRAAKRQGSSVGALFVDLDHFKVVNDSLGHGAGDEVLAAVSHRIVSALRPGDRVGRFGGDEFVIVLQDVHDIVEVERCADRVSNAIAVDLQVLGHRIVPTASIGIAVSTPASTPDSLLRDTDSALFRAKTAGRARWQFFDDAMHDQAVARLTVEDQLRDAIRRREFVVYYQPIVALADDRVVGHEALVRWEHPTRGMLGPNEFLDIAEDTGLVTAMGAQVMDQALASLAECPDLVGTMSVNVSAVQLAAPDWLGSVRAALARHRVDPTRFVIEVTETAVLSLVDSARRSLTSLRGLGVGIHVDDFGTGYSSISVLRDLPVTGVKLDLRFVHDLTSGDSQDNALAQGLIGLVKGLHMTGIAEGIETRAQAEILRAQGWQCGQGYYFGSPDAMPPASRLIGPRSRSADASWREKGTA